MRQVLVILMLILSALSVFGGQIEYDYSPYGEEVSIYQIDLSDDNKWNYYTGVNYPLPYYVPQGAWSKLVNGGSSITSIGTHVPRYFDGTKFTDFRVDVFDVDELTEVESNLMDELQVTIHHENNTDGQCEINILVSTTKQVGSGPLAYSSDTNTQLYSVPMAYDLGYLNLPSIKSLLKDDDYFEYLFGYDGIDIGVSYTGTGKKDVPQDVYNLFYAQYGSNAEFVNFHEVLEAGVGLYENDTTIIEDWYGVGSYLISTGNRNDFKRCTVYVADLGSSISDACYSENDLIVAYNIIDEWMFELLYGNGFVDANCLSDINDLSPEDSRNYFICKAKLSNGGINLFNIDSIFKGSKGVEYLANCLNYVQDVQNSFCSKSYSSQEIQDFIWDDLKKSAFDIPKGTNMFPLNVAQLRYKCDASQNRWDKDVFFDTDSFTNNKLKPYAESSTKYCDYSTYANDETPNATLEIVFQANPIFNLVAGATSVDDAQTFEWLSIFANAGFNTNATVNAGREKFIWSLEHTVDRGEYDGCTVYMTVEQANTTSVNLIEDVINPLNQDVEQVSQELKNLVDQELMFYKSEKEQSDFILLLLNIARFMNRVHIIIYYIISMIIFFTVFSLVAGIPLKFIKGIKNVYNTKFNSDDKRVF